MNGSGVLVAVGVSEFFTFEFGVGGGGAVAVGVGIVVGSGIGVAVGNIVAVITAVGEGTVVRVGVGVEVATGVGAGTRIGAGMGVVSGNAIGNGTEVAVSDGRSTWVPVAVTTITRAVRSSAGVLETGGIPLITTVGLGIPVDVMSKVDADVAEETVGVAEDPALHALNNKANDNNRAILLPIVSAFDRNFMVLVMTSAKILEGTTGSARTVCESVPKFGDCPARTIIP